MTVLKVKVLDKENLPLPLFAKEGIYLPLVKGGRRDFINNFSLIKISTIIMEMVK
jgi:hypothetical protein